MSTLERCARAARNNAHWCDTLCRANGGSGELHSAYWINRGSAPPCTPKLITLAGQEHAASQRAALESLIAADPAASFSVKDAFACLELAPLGFSVLFDAVWLVLGPEDPLPVDLAERVEWSLVEHSAELVEWERVWRRSAAVRLGDAPLFPPSLLHVPDLHFLAGRRDGALVATAALNRTPDAVGLSNVSSACADAGPLFPGCVRLARALHPDVALVGYERGDALAAAEQAGFGRVGALVVWQRGAPLP